MFTTAFRPQTQGMRFETAYNVYVIRCIQNAYSLEYVCQYSSISCDPRRSAELYRITSGTVSIFQSSAVEFLEPHSLGFGLKIVLPLGWLRTTVTKSNMGRWDGYLCHNGHRVIGFNPTRLHTSWDHAYSMMLLPKYIKFKWILSVL